MQGLCHFVPIFHKKKLALKGLSFRRQQIVILSDVAAWLIIYFTTYSVSSRKSRIISNVVPSRITEPSIGLETATFLVAQDALRRPWATVVLSMQSAPTPWQHCALSNQYRAHLFLFFSRTTAPISINFVFSFSSGTPGLGRHNNWTSSVLPGVLILIYDQVRD